MTKSRPGDSTYFYLLIGYMLYTGWQWGLFTLTVITLRVRIPVSAIVLVSQPPVLIATLHLTLEEDEF
jgi:hypothetical protein